jgi:hypothetical protein
VRSNTLAAADHLDREFPSGGDGWVDYENSHWDAAKESHRIGKKAWLSI